MNIRVFKNFGQPFRPSGLSKKLQYLSGSVRTNQECLTNWFRDWFPYMLNVSQMAELQKEFPEIHNDFWNKYPEMLETFKKNIPGMSDAFWDKLSRMSYNFRSMFPRNLNYFWDKSPGILESLKQNFPKLSDNFWKVLPWKLVDFVKSWNPESMLCIGYPGGNACGGDSGGPLVVKINNAYTVIGVISWGDGPGVKSCGGIGVYAKVAKYINFINLIN